MTSHPAAASLVDLVARRAIITAAIASHTTNHDPDQPGLFDLSAVRPRAQVIVLPPVARRTGSVIEHVAGRNTSTHRHLSLV